MARNLKNLIDSYYEDEDSEELFDETDDRKPMRMKKNTVKKRSQVQEDIQKQRRAKNKMRQESARQYEDQYEE